MLTHFIIDDLPKEFGEVTVVSGHRDLRDAKFLLDLFRGHDSGDSYSHQYFRIFSSTKLKRIYPDLVLVK